jgi:hypothetical protein
MAVHSRPTVPQTRSPGPKTEVSGQGAGKRDNQWGHRGTVAITCFTLIIALSCPDCRARCYRDN